MEWRKGSVENILLRGQMQIKELAWDLDKGKISLQITSEIEQEIEVRLPEELSLNNVEINGKSVSIDSKKLKIKL